MPVESQGKSNSVLVIDGDILSRHAIADYLRRCGYIVVEAVSTDEAMAALSEPILSIDVIMCDVQAIGTQSAFQFANWVKQNHPALAVKLAGDLASVATTAAELCEGGPHLARPYEPQAVVDYIFQLRAERDRGKALSQPD